MTADTDPAVGDGDGQHDAVRVFYERPPGCHEYVAGHLDDAGLFG